MHVCVVVDGDDPLQAEVMDIALILPICALVPVFSKHVASAEPWHRSPRALEWAGGETYMCKEDHLKLQETTETKEDSD